MGTPRYLPLLLIALLSCVSAKTAKPTTSTERDEIFRLIRKIIQQPQLTHSNLSDSIFVVGKTGTGKTPLVKWLCEDNSQLMSVMKKLPNSKHPIYLMNGTFGKFSTQSQTLFPELYEVDDSVAYYDFPGFKDNRGAAYELVTGYFMRQMTDRARNVKILFVVEFNALLTNRDLFTNRIKSFVDFVNDLDKYHESIALVVTQVPNEINNVNISKDFVAIDLIKKNLQKIRWQYVTKKSDSRYIAAIDILYRNVGIFRYVYQEGAYSEIESLKFGKLIIQEIINNLNFTEASADDFAQVLSAESLKVLEDVVHGLLQEDVYPKMQRFISNAGNFFSRALDLDEGTNFTELSVSIECYLKFLDGHQDIASAADFEMKLDQLNIGSANLSRMITSMLNETSAYTKSVELLREIATTSPINIKEPSELRASMSLASANLVRDVKTAIRGMDKRLGKIVEDKILLHLKQLEGNWVNFQKFLNMTTSVFALLDNSSIDDHTKIINILSGIDSENAKKVVDWNNFMTKFPRYQVDPKESKIPSEISDLTDYTFDCNIWYAFILNVIKDLTTLGSSGNWQNLVDFDPGEGEDTKKDDFVNFLETTMKNHTTITTSGLRDMKETYIDFIKLVAFKHVKKTYLDYETDVQFTHSSKLLRVTGKNVKLSDAAKQVEWAKASEIEIFALNRVYLDKNVEAKSKKLTIIAPTWEVVEKVKISLNGDDGVAYDGPAQESVTLLNADAGNPGNPGNPGGHFLGIGEIFINPGSLTIEANGGNGGPGQVGGKGYNGDNAPEMSTGECRKTMYSGGLCYYYWAENKFTRNAACNSTSEDKVYHEGNMFALRHKYGGGSMGLETFPRCNTAGLDKVYNNDYLCTITADGAHMSSSGGNGGPGGVIGRAGTISVIGLNQDPTDIEYSLVNGTMGTPGQAGESGADVSGEIIDVYKTEHLEYGWITGNEQCRFAAYTITNRRKYTLVAPKGTIGNNSENTEEPIELAPMDKAISINAFKDYLRSSWSSNGFNIRSEDWLLRIENNDNIHQLYDTAGFLDEFTNLERQYLTLRNRGYSVLRLLESLKERVINFATNKSNNTVIEWLYAAVQTKIFARKGNKNKNTVVDMLMFLDTFKKDIESLKTMANAKAIFDEEERFLGILEKKVKSAQSAIDNLIVPGIKKNVVLMQKDLQQFRNEIADKLTAAEDKIQVLKENKKRIQQEARRAMIFSGMKIIAGVASVFSPFAGALTLSAASLLQSTTSSTIPSLIGQVSKGFSQTFDRFKFEKQEYTDKITVIEKLSRELDDETKLDTKRTQEIEDTKKHLEELRNDENINNPVRLLEIQQQTKKLEQLQKQQEEELKQKLIGDRAKKSVAKGITVAKKDLDKLKDDKRSYLPSHHQEIQKQRKELSELLKTEEKNLKADKTDKEIATDKKIQCINSMVRVLDAVNVISTDMNDMAIKAGQVEKAERQIKAAEKELDKMKAFEGKMMDAMVPAFANVNQLQNTLRKSLKGLSHHELDVKQWQITQILKDMMTSFSKLLDGFDIEADFKRSLDRVMESMNIVVEVYDRIESYIDTGNMATFMAKLALPADFGKSDIPPEFVEDVKKLERVIKSNLLYEGYESALKSFRQRYFPLSKKVLARFLLSDNGSVNAETMAGAVTAKVLDLSDTIKHELSIITSIDKDITRHHNISFYTWSDRNMISQLLNGSEVIALANAADVDMNAVKFEIIDVRFKLVNEDAQKKFNAELVTCNVTLKMLDANYYRCGQNLMSFSMDQDMVIIHSYNKYDHPDSYSYVYINELGYKIMKNYAFLSPYGLWSIQLTEVNFKKLSEYIDLVEYVELHGSGIFSKFISPELCDDAGIN